jgi:signal transduction histidine kinase
VPENVPLDGRGKPLTVPPGEHDTVPGSAADPVSSGDDSVVTGGGGGSVVPGGRDSLVPGVPGAATAPGGAHVSGTGRLGLVLPGSQPGASAGDRPGTDAAGRPSTDGAGQHVFDRWNWWWDVYFALVLAATVGVASQSGEPAPKPALAVAVLLAMAVLYLAIGRRVIADRARPATGAIFVASLVILFVAAESLDSNSGWILFALCPLSFMAVPLRRAIPAVLVLNLTPVVFLAKPGQHSEGQVIAVLTIAFTGAVFSVAFGTWVTRIINQSVERAELIGKLEAAQAELAEVNHRAGTLAERQRLAGEIHDTLAQGLSSIVMLLQAAESKITADPDEARRHVGLATKTARESLAEARAMVAALTPTHLESSTLPDALRRLTDRIGAELAMDARFDLRGDTRPLPATAEVVLLRVGQEALANVRKHSGAQRVQVTLSYGDGAARLEVTDDGAGFDPGQVSGGYGLRGMRVRILQAGGGFDVRTQPGAGTALSVEVPC